jgi:hypothetical protein
MGRGRIKDKNKIKKQYLNQAVAYIERLEAENKALKEDPNTVIGQFIGQFRELYGQNSRLSVLAACLIKQVGESVVMTKAELEQFQNKRINIKWEIADGETVETAKEYTFTYELQEAPPQGQPVQATQQPGEVEVDFPECTDPDCTLPKELKHRHDKAPIEALGDSLVVGETSDEIPPEVEEPLEHECTDPDCSATENGPHIHVKEPATP